MNLFFDKQTRSFRRLWIIVLLFALNISTVFGQWDQYKLGVLDLSPDNYSDGSEYLSQAGGKMYFMKDRNLWSTDGTIDNTHLVKEGINNNYYVNTIGPYLIFDHDDEFWTTDGTPENTHFLLKDLNFSSSINGAVFKGELHFFYDDGIHGKELWKTDGTPSGTQLVFESLPGSETLFNRAVLLKTNGQLLFFQVFNPEFGQDIWTSDGTLVGTKPLFEKVEERKFQGPSGLTRVNDEMFFDARGDFWKTDGTLEGTTLVKKGCRFFSGTFISNNYLFVSFDGVWKTDGTPEGTQLIKILEGIVSLPYGNIKSFGNRVLFVLDEEQYRSEPWVSDGTAEGTQLLKDIGTFSSMESGFIVKDNYAYFIAQSALWRTDGTSDGTQSLGFEWPFIDRPRSLTPYKGKIYFIAGSNVYGQEIFYLDFGLSPGITGQVYQDENQNGQKDTDERGLANIPIKASSETGTQTTYTDENGAYQFYVDTACYSITPTLSDCYEISSDSTSFKVDFNTDPVEKLDFGLRLVGGQTSMQLSIHSAPTRCGFTVPLWINVANTGCTDFTGDMYLVLDDRVEVIDYDISPTSILGDTIQWNISENSLSQNQQFRITVKIPGEEFVGDQLVFQAMIFDPNKNEITQNDLISEIRCATDPNDKQVLPARSEPSNSNYTLHDETLTYTLRFQNTGSDTAFNVRIIDTLSASLDFSTFQPLAASHPNQISLSDEGVLIFLFNDILLPDSSVNLVGSNGFVSFQIDTKDMLEDFTVISNKVGIYFDFNSPVITNTIQSTLVTSLDADEDGFPFWEDCNDTTAAINPNIQEIPNNGIDEDCDGADLVTSIVDLNNLQVEIFPNPTSGKLQINFNQIQQFRIQLFDLNGRPVKEIQRQASQFQLEVDDLPAGIYYLHVRNPKLKHAIRKKIVVVD